MRKSEQPTEELQTLHEEVLKAQFRLAEAKAELRSARLDAEGAMVAFDHALQRHLGQLTLFKEDDHG